MENIEFKVLVQYKNGEKIGILVNGTVVGKAVIMYKHGITKKSGGLYFGSMTKEDASYYFCDFEVEEKYRKHGYGTMLLKYAIDKCKGGFFYLWCYEHMLDYYFKRGLKEPEYGAYKRNKPREYYSLVMDLRNK